MAVRTERNRHALRQAREDRKIMAAEAKQESDIRKFEEIGTHSAAPKLAIGEALVFHNAIGGKRKEARLRYLSRYWMNRLKDVPKIRFNTSFDSNQSCAIGNVQVDGTNPEAVRSEERRVGKECRS